MIISIFLFLSIFFFLFHDLILHITTNLCDWFDYPYYVWVIYQNIAKIKTLDFYHYFDTTAFYPHKMTLLFSDILLPQSLLALPLSIVFKNQILVFNLIFLATFLLDFICLFLFWKQIFKKDTLALFGSLTTFFIFINLQLGHFQMMFYWPFFLCFYFVLKNEKNHKTSNLIKASFLLSVQFLASVYIAFFLLLALGVYFLTRFLFDGDKVKATKKFLATLVIFLLLDGLFIKGYLDMKKNYQVKRSINEYIAYSAHVTDYLFVKADSTFLYSQAFIKKWNQLDKHKVGERAVFPGFLLTLSAILGMFVIKKEKNNYSIKIMLGKNGFFFLLLLVTGFTFSLGPRINFNGNYDHLPTPYALLLKFVPFLDTVRAPARWSYLFYVGIIYFAMSFLSSFNLNKKNTLSWLVFLMILAEYLPLPIRTHQESYLNNDYEILKKICSKEKKIVLELPITHFTVKGGIATGLNYISKVELASVYHNCYLINGYSGYDLPQLMDLDNKINLYINENDAQRFIQELRKTHADYLKVNPDKIISSNWEDIEKKIIEKDTERITNTLLKIN